MRVKVLSRVDRLLDMSQTYRDSDKRLQLAIWRSEGLWLTPEQQKHFVEKCSTAESITRARRKLKDKYPASKQIDDERFKKYNIYRQGEIL